MEPESILAGEPVGDLSSDVGTKTKDSGGKPNKNIINLPNPGRDIDGIESDSHSQANDRICSDGALVTNDGTGTLNNRWSVLEDLRALIFEYGSHSCKIGLAGDDAPQEVLLSAIGYPENTLTNQDRRAVGEDGFKSNNIDVKYPIKNRVITDWDAMEKIWHYSFHDSLRVSPDEHPVLMTEAALNPKVNREKTTQIMFEKFNVPYFYLASEPVLSLYASGSTTGVVLQSGHGQTVAIPVYEGFPLSLSIKSSPIAGDEVTEYLAKALGREQSFPLTTSRRTLQEMKEKTCYVAMDFDSEVDKNGTKSFELPDGNIIELGTAVRCRSAEILFQPSLLDVDTIFKGVHDLVFQSIMKSDVDIRRDLFANVVLAGGSTMFPGFAERFTKELVDLAPFGLKIEVVACPERKHSAWIGGSMLASTSGFQQMCISKAEYDEVGPSIVNRKCF